MALCVVHDPVKADRPSRKPSLDAHRLRSSHAIASRAVSWLDIRSLGVRTYCTSSKNAVGDSTDTGLSWLELDNLNRHADKARNHPIRAMPKHVCRKSISVQCALLVMRMRRHVVAEYYTGRQPLQATHLTPTLDAKALGAGRACTW
jgi:hypothetical protein